MLIYNLALLWSKWTGSLAEELMLAVRGVVEKGSSLGSILKR